MPIIFGTILFPLIIMYAVFIDNATLTFEEILLIWPFTVGVLLILRVITVFKNISNEKSQAAGEKLGKRMVDSLFGEKEIKHNEKV